MAVSPSWLAYVVEQLQRVEPVTSRRMFGGAGIYCHGLFFALVDEDRLYFKADDTTRGDFERAGMEPFRPFGDERAMAYWELPGDLLEDPDALRPWMEKAIDVARRAKKK